MAGERLASAARRVARAPSRLYCWGGRLDIAFAFRTFVGEGARCVKEQLTTQTAGMAYFPLTAASRMALALLFWSRPMVEAELSESGIIEGRHRSIRIERIE